MTIRRKSHNLDADLLDRARRALGLATETETIHEALRAVVRGEEIARDATTPEALLEAAGVVG